LSCPLIIVSWWLKRLYIPDYAADMSTSYTYWLYRRFGRWAAIPIFMLIMIAAVVIKHIFIR
jgi:hypothetical protein